MSQRCIECGHNKSFESGCAECGGNMIEHTIIGDASIPIIEQGLGRRLRPQSKDQQIADLKAQVELLKAKLGFEIKCHNATQEQLDNMRADRHDLKAQVEFKDKVVDVLTGRFTCPPIPEEMCRQEFNSPMDWDVCKSCKIEWAEAKAKDGVDLLVGGYQAKAGGE